METWARLRGDAPGETLNTNMTAAISTLIPPPATAARVERAVEVRSNNAERIVYLINPDCRVRGEPARSRVIMDAFLDGTLEQTDPTHPFLDCMAGLHNAHALLDWMKKGVNHRLTYAANRQRTLMVPGSSTTVMGSVATGSTRRLAVAAALMRVGIGLYNIVGNGNSHEFVMHARGLPLLNAKGEQVIYDTEDLITRLNDGRLYKEDPDHPFLMAYMARRNRDNLMAHVDREVPLLLLTPDAFRGPAGHKKGTYDPQGVHAYITPNASGENYDAVEKHFFG